METENNCEEGGDMDSRMDEEVSKYMSKMSISGGDQRLPTSTELLRNGFRNIMMTRKSESITSWILEANGHLPVHAVIEDDDEDWEKTATNPPLVAPPQFKTYYNKGRARKRSLKPAKRSHNHKRKRLLRIKELKAAVAAAAAAAAPFNQLSLVFPTKPEAKIKQDVKDSDGNCFQ